MMPRRSYSRTRARKPVLGPQGLEARILLAGDLVAFWRADDLHESHADGDAVSAWTDSVGGLAATAVGAPVLDGENFVGRSAIRLDQDVEAQSFVLTPDANPLVGAQDFSVSVAFRTTAQDLVGADGEWFTQTGLVDMSQAGLSRDWGLAINQEGRISGGVGSGLFAPPTTVHSEEAGLNDGLLHVATFVRQAGNISIIVDDGPAATRQGADEMPRDAVALSFGSLSSGEQRFTGDLAEVRVFDGGLTVAEAHEVYRQIVVPIANDDFFFGTPGEPITIDASAGVIANDVAYLADPLAATLVTRPQRGTLALSDDGSFVYTANESFSSGVDTFTYRATNGALSSHEATVSVVLNTKDDQQAIVINELHVNPDVDTELVEFIELFNPTATPVSLGGWFFDDGVSYSFPEDAWIAAGGYQVVTQDAEHFALKFGVGANGQFQGRLSNEGETVSLRSDSADLIDRVDFGQGFPWPTVGDEPGYSMELINASLDNQLGGSWRSSVGNQIVFDTGESWQYFKGTSEPSVDPSEWKQAAFDDRSWLAGNTPIGYGRNLTVSTELDDMRRNYSTAYLRKEFHIDDPQAVGGLELHTFFDDGINVWINGVRVANHNTETENLPFDALATGRHGANSAETYLLPDPAAYLVPGKNVVSVHLLNDSLSGTDIFFDAALRNTSKRAPGPTPGKENSIVSNSSGPQVRQVDHSPVQPASSQDVTIRIKATDPDGVSRVTLEYQVVEPGDYIRVTDSEFSTKWSSMPMRDDGTNGDSAANDSVYTAVLSAENYTHRQLVRYRVQAEDQIGDVVSVPYADDPQPNFAFFVYDGIPDWSGADRPGETEPTTFGQEVMNQLATYHLIADAEDVQSSQYRSQFEEVRFRGTMVYDGQVYDHIEFRVRGEFSTYVAGKNKWKFFFNRGHEFQAHDNYGRPFAATRRVLNFSAATTPWMPMNRGMAGIGEAIAYRLYDLAGIPSPDTNFVQFRVIDDVLESSENQYESDLWGLYLALEHPDGRFLDERGLPDGTTFKMEGGSGAGDIKNQGPTQPDAGRDLRTFMSQARRAGEEEFWRENVDLDAYYTFRAINREINNMDIRDGWNHYIYRNPETNRYTQVPWDLDMLYIPTTHWSGVTRIENSLRHDAINIEYQNRGRELQDLLFAPDQIGTLVDEYAGFVNPATGNMTMVDVDQFMWNHNPRTAGAHRGAFNRQTAGYESIGGDGQRTMVSGDHEGFAEWIKDFMLPEPGAGSEPAAYGWNFLKRESRDADAPDRPVINYIGAANFPLDNLRFQASSFVDPQGNNTFGAIEWRLAEITDPDAPVFDPQAPKIYEVQSLWNSGRLDDFGQAVTIPSDVARPGHAYRARVRVFDDTGRASHWSDPIQFIAAAGNPTELINGLRISEVHYNPSDPTADEAAAGFNDANEFEFIEFVNIGAETIQLKNAELVEVDAGAGPEGVDFSFANSQITHLEPGARVVVVENQAAFEFRYGDTVPVAGQWAGRLSNRQETLTLQAAGVVIQQFSYVDDWYPTTDGNGRSLEIVDPRLSVNGWNERTAWQPSSPVGGTPGSEPVIAGDANRDRRFDQADLIQIFQAGEYEDAIPGNSRWETGDWNGDGDFTSSDLVLAFRAGGFRAALRPVDAQVVDHLFRVAG